MSQIEKILYVEDEPDIQMIAEIALRDVGGFTLEVCSSGKEAIEKAEGFKPDLILLDVMMPEMNGPDTLLELRKLNVTAATPVIFMTAKVQPQEVEYYKDIGAIDVISKPFDPMNLANQIRTIMSTS
jgi:CheY-like chemotaxis protein